MTIVSPTLTVMINAVRKAAKAITRDFNEIDKLQVSRKGVADFATNADRKSEKILFDELQKARPTYSFLMEESGEVKGTENLQWVIDPIDGTHNFIHAIPHFCISVGLEKIHPDGKREGQAAVIYDLVHDELFMAERGQGAYMNDRRLLVSGRRELETSVIACVAPRPSPVYAEHLARFTRFSTHPCSLRCSGSTALDLAYVAAGRVDAAWFIGQVKRWDIAAGLLLVREAGGSAEEIPANGEAAALLLVSNGHLHEKFKTALS